MAHSFLPPDPASPGLTPDPSQAAAIRRWTAEVLALGDDATVTVNELACRDPGCPLLETVVAVFEPHRTRRWRFTRPRAAVTKLMLQQTLATPPESTARPPG